jgi:hypothetical protein
MNTTAIFFLHLEQSVGCIDIPPKRSRQAGGFSTGFTD